jgi:hypothetical protein
VDKQSTLNPNHLPSGTNVYFLVLVITSLMVSFWSGQFLPRLAYFTTPFNAAMQPGISFTGNGLYGIAICFICSILLFAYHTNRQRGLFGPASELSKAHSAWETVQTLARQMGVRIKALLVDGDLRNADALAFGFSETHTILMGKAFFSFR